MNSAISAILIELRRYRRLADKALAQVSDENFFRALSPEENSVGTIVKHVAGNMHSRWTDFLDSDGEKPSRRRDEEFEIESADTRESVMRAWNSGWETALASVAALSEKQLTQTVRIRDEEMTAFEAILRSLAHYASHTGQIILLAKHFSGDNWQTLSIPKRQPQARS